MAFSQISVKDIQEFMLIPPLEKVIYSGPDKQAIVPALPVSPFGAEVSVINPFSNRRQPYLCAKRLKLFYKVFIAKPVAPHIYLAYNADNRLIFFLMDGYGKECLLCLCQFLCRESPLPYGGAYFMDAVPVCLFCFAGDFFIRPCLS